uniref:Uncharacterized protein n=1 Tax=Vespula pensylvanica TaxID=30213 RepID=A0A834KJL2_VESPE|nr:hypothetical protein H0235_014046 [Vespula pensylvanica]
MGFVEKEREEEKEGEGVDVDSEVDEENEDEEKEERGCVRGRGASDSPQMWRTARLRLTSLVHENERSPAAFP